MSSRLQHHNNNNFQFDETLFEISGVTFIDVIVVVFCAATLLSCFIYLRLLWGSMTNIPTMAPPVPPPSGGLHTSKIDKLPTVTYQNSGNFSHAECSICLGIFVDGETVKVMPSCGHYFHSECVDKWLAVDSSCPICRARIRVNDSLV